MLKLTLTQDEAYSSLSGNKIGFWRVTVIRKWTQNGTVFQLPSERKKISSGALGLFENEILQNSTNLLEGERTR